MDTKVIHGDSLEVLKHLPENSIDSVVTDPPYELGFMGKSWDSTGIANNVELWKHVLRVLKPGGHLLSFGGTRTYHRMACAIEDAGFEIRDQIQWVYGSGFPKSLNIGKAVDKLQGNEREIIGQSKNGKNSLMGGLSDKETTIIQDITKGNSEWEGWGTALKPANEPIVLARKPLSEKTVAENVLKWGTGGINIDGCRVGYDEITINAFDDGAKPFGNGAGHPYTSRTQVGRWPANLIHDGSDEVVGMFPNESARFFYSAKCSKKDREEGLGAFRTKQYSHDGRETPIENAYQRNNSKARNHHPTVKPTELMRYLCRLITPPGGTVLDPFTGSGSTGKAAVLEGFNFIGIEKELEYVNIATARILHASQ